MFKNALSNNTTDPNNKGATLLEYCLMALLIAASCIVAVTFFGSEINKSFSNPKLTTALKPE